MKTIYFEIGEKEYKRIVKAKDASKLNWRNFILWLVNESAKKNFKEFDK
jgi:hypothetical protein